MTIFSLFMYIRDFYTQGYLNYEECNHTIKEYAKMPEEYVNLNQEELAKKQENWQIEEFSKDEVTLLKDVTSVCNEHYVLREKDGIIAVYQIHEDNTVFCY